MPAKGRQPNVSDSEILELIQTSQEWLGRPFVTASELADRLDMSRQGVHRRLQNLADNGDIRKYKPGRAAIWWTEN